MGSNRRIHGRPQSQRSIRLATRMASVNDALPAFPCSLGSLIRQCLPEVTIACISDQKNSKEAGGWQGAVTPGADRKDRGLRGSLDGYGKTDYEAENTLASPRPN